MTGHQTFAVLITSGRKAKLKQYRIDVKQVDRYVHPTLVWKELRLKVQLVRHRNRTEFGPAVSIGRPRLVTATVK